MTEMNVACPECYPELLVEQESDEGGVFWVCPICSAAYDAADLERDRPAPSGESRTAGRSHEHT